MNSDVYVAFLDVLGFKDLVNNNSHEDLVRKYQNLFAANTESSLANGAFTVVENDGKRMAMADCTKITVNSIIISDSVILWTPNASMKSFIDIIVATRNMLVQGIFTGMPLRGGIAIGPLSRLSGRLNSQTENVVETFVGKALVEANQIESSQQWAGCVISPKAVAFYTEDYQRHSTTLPDLASVDYLIDAGLIINYNVPMHCGLESHTVINWPRGNKTPPSRSTVQQAFGMHKKSTDHPTIQIKINNTLQFLDAMLPSCT